MSKPRPPAKPPSKLCHALVAETAKAMAADAISMMLQDNEMYKAAKAKYGDAGVARIEATLLEKTWPQLIEQARATLAKMLAGPMSDELKTPILDALILDNALYGRSRSSGSRIPGLATKH